MNYEPNFFIVGVPKSGTTAISEYLGDHPNVFMSHPKEPHFFADDFPMYKKALPELSDYLALFNNISPEVVAIGEASVYYLYSKVALNNIYKFNPEARIIVMLRNPINLVQSMHAQLLWTLDEDVEDVEEAWHLQRNRKQGINIPTRCREPAFLQYGELFLMGEQVEKLTHIFPASQIKYLLFEDLKNDTRKVYRELCEFLGLPDDGRENFQQVNARKRNVNSLLARFTQRPPKILVDFIREGKRVFRVERLNIMQRLQQINAENQSPKMLSQEFLQELRGHFKEDIELLEESIHKDLTSWKR